MELDRFGDVFFKLIEQASLISDLGSWVTENLEVTFQAAS